ncbi:MAG: DNA translocase FtsK 4TM domain-containing protein [Alphaproteobacteria bacterium]|nr:DNA translocase FtsK 4TM domain-containing protein [Alphaproteobacteria bacterium]
MSRFFPDKYYYQFRIIGSKIIGLFLILIGIVACVSLFSYHESDPSINTATGANVNNWLKFLGAGIGYRSSYFADIMWQFVGVSSIFLPISIIAWGLITFNNRWSKKQFWRVLCFFPTLVVLCILCCLFPWHKDFWPLYATDCGGTFVSTYYTTFVENLGKVNMYLVQCGMAILAFFGISLTLGIPYRLIKKWAIWLRNITKIILIWIWNRVILRKKAEKEETKENDNSLTELLSDKKEENKEENERLLDLQLKPQVKRTRKTDNSIVDNIANEQKYKKSYQLPPSSKLAKPDFSKMFIPSKDELDEIAKHLEDALGQFGIKGKIVGSRPGPVLTVFDLELASGIKESRVIGLAPDIARIMSAKSVRIASVSGTSLIGIEIPNSKRSTVYMRELVDSKEFKDCSMQLPMILGKDIGGKPVIANLAKMPHLLVAGTTGSGKSVAVNTMILSLIYKLTPDQVKFIMIDPKMLEFSVYQRIPHLISPIVTDYKKAVVALNWVCKEMDNRYITMSKVGVRNIEGYNEKVRSMQANGEKFVEEIVEYEDGIPTVKKKETELKLFNYIVVFIDELSELMCVVRKEVEPPILRIAQKARAAGIHLIMATQRPSVDVIPGTIKSNFPERLSLRLTTKTDSRTILGDQGGAEQLLGNGDMLYVPQGQQPIRIQGPFVSDEEVNEITAYCRSQGTPEYIDEVVQEVVQKDVENLTQNGNAEIKKVNAETQEDALYQKAIDIVLNDEKASISYLQRKMQVGYNKAANFIEKMEEDGIISAPVGGASKREILKKKD